MSSNGNGRPKYGKHGRGRRLWHDRPDLLAECKRLYTEEAASFEKIEERLGISRATARTWLVECGLHPVAPKRTQSVRTRVYSPRPGRPQTVVALLSLLPPAELAALGRALAGGGWTSAARRAASTPLDQLLR